MVNTDKQELLNMGFESARVEWALKATGNRGLQPALDHLLEHSAEPVPDLSAVTEKAGSSSAPMDVDDDDEDTEALRALGVLKGPGPSAADAEAKSIKCTECGKTFKNTALANFHAEKSGHDQFEESTEEIKPLTEEERKQKLAELREKMAEKRAKKAVEEAKENKANEALRRKAGKDLNVLKEELRTKEAMKEAEAKRREKIEDQKARAAIKAQIEADKKARAEKAAREKAIRDGQAVVDSVAGTSESPAAIAARTGGSSKDAKETRLQIRLSTGGPPLTTTLSSDAPLREVAEFVGGHSMADVESVTFTQNYPRKTFGTSDHGKSLRDLGLTPSAVLIANI